MTVTKAIVVFGERPGPRTDPRQPLFPHTTTGAAAKLIRLLGWTTEEYLQRTTRINVFHDGAHALGLQAARRRVERYMTVAIARHGAPVFVAVGRETLRALPQFYRSMEAAETRDLVMYLPHTSGVNRWYNSQDNTELATRVLREHVAKAPPQAPTAPPAAAASPAHPAHGDSATQPSETV